MTHDECMRRAIELVRHCNPRDPRRTPRLGVVIMLRDGNERIEAHRGTGMPGDDDHAELIACRQVRPAERMYGATVYTTLEPCTHHTRRSTSESCTDLLIRQRVAKVVIGILDPNQAVCGRGFNQLQQADIEVEMFPHRLAMDVRAGNADFIRAQQTCMPHILAPKPGSVFVLEPQPHGGHYTKVEVRFESDVPPDINVGLIIQEGANWWPQIYPISRVPDTREYRAIVGLGAPGPRTIHIVRANALGMAAVDFFKRVITQNEKRIEYLRERLKDIKIPQDCWDKMPSNYQPLRFNELPNGLDSLASVTIESQLPR